MEHRAARDDASGDDHGFLLSYYGLYAYIRSKRAASSVRGGPDRDLVRWTLKFLLAAGDGGCLGPIREKAAADYLYGSGAVDRIPRDAVADSSAVIRAVVVGTTLAVVYLRKLQRRHGRYLNGDHAGRRSHERILTSLQPRDGFIGRVYPGALYLPDSYHREPRRAGALDVLCGGAWFNCRPRDSTQS